jgi:protein involved in polysaccharide export with SLBB domain
VLPDYILKPRDEIHVDIWGDLNLHYALPLSADGFIIIPEAGRISLNGLTYAEAKKKILNHLACTYAFFIDAENPGAGKAPVDITLGKTAGLNVFVTGEVKRLGSVNINGINASLVSILRKSGIRDQASTRRIELKKLDGKVYVFDLYDFLLKGNLPLAFKYLNDGDIIFVRLRDKDVNMTGSIRRPGRYELLPGEKLDDAIRIAGGVLSSAQKEIRIFRKANGTSDKVINEIDTEIGSNCELQDQDVIDISGLNDAEEKYYVTVLGEVKHPSNYAYFKNEKVNELIARCGGVSDEAFLEGSQFFRNDSLTIVDLPTALRDTQSACNFSIMPGDRIIVPRPNSFIMVKGAVISPVGIAFEKGKTVDYYISKAGGYKDDADQANVTIVSLNGTVKRGNAGFWTADPLVPLGAVIVVPDLSGNAPVTLKDAMADSNK